MPTVNDVGKPDAGEPHVRFEVAAGGASVPLAFGPKGRGASRRPYSWRSVTGD